MRAHALAPLRLGVLAAAFLLALLVLAHPRAGAQNAPAQAPKPRPKWTVLLCADTIAVPGAVAFPRAAIVVEDGRIRHVVVGAKDAASIPGAQGADIVETIDLAGLTVLPGLIDCHTHITWELGPYSRYEALMKTDPAMAFDGVRFAQRTLLAGFTTIRNVGSTGDSALALRDAINEGIVAGPRILDAGKALSPTGGHGDATNGVRQDLFAVPTPFTGVADGPDECRKAVRNQIKRGVDVIKLTATGGVLSLTDAGLRQQFFDDELQAIVETAHSMGRKVAAHAHGVDGVNAALRAGVDSIEHGTFLDDESVRLFNEKGAYLVPTLIAGRTVIEMANDANFPVLPAVQRKALAVGPAMKEGFARALKGGVKIAFGTDAGVCKHGINAQEFSLMVEAGMQPEQAIASATTAAADLLGLSREIGTLEPGKSADIIAVRADPRKDVKALQDVAFVMRAGVVHKRP